MKSKNQNKIEVAKAINDGFVHLCAYVKGKIVFDVLPMVFFNSDEVHVSICPDKASLVVLYRITTKTGLRGYALMSFDDDEAE